MTKTRKTTSKRALIYFFFCRKRYTWGKMSALKYRACAIQSSSKVIKFVKIPKQKCESQVNQLVLCSVIKYAVSANQSVRYVGTLL